MNRTSDRPPAPGYIEAGAVYRLDELARRLGWGDDSIAAARKAGLRLVQFGRRKYALGTDVAAFFEQLACKQCGGAYQRPELSKADRADDRSPK